MHLLDNLSILFLRCKIFNKVQHTLLLFCRKSQSEKQEAKPKPNANCESQNTQKAYEAIPELLVFPVICSTPVEMSETGAYEEIGHSSATTNPSSYQIAQNNNNEVHGFVTTNPPVSDAVDEPNAEEYEEIPEDKPYSTTQN